VLLIPLLNILGVIMERSSGTLLIRRVIRGNYPKWPQIALLDFHAFDIKNFDFRRIGITRITELRLLRILARGFDGV